jgi:hypothetical protein
MAFKIPIVSDLVGGISNFAQLYNAPLIGSFFENPHEAEKQRTMSEAARYFQQQRPEMVQTQMNQLNNRLAAYQGAADVMASLGIPTQGIQYAGVNPFGPGSYGATPYPPLSTETPGAMAVQQKNYDDLARKEQPTLNPFGGSHPERQKVPPIRDNGDGTLSRIEPDGKGGYREVRYSKTTGLAMDPYLGEGQVGANDQGTLRPGYGE